MIRLLARLTLQVLANAVGLVLAASILSGFTLSASGFVVSLALFSLAQIVLEPLMLKWSIRYIPALRGGIALVTTFASLLVTSLLSNGLTIRGLQTWIAVPLVVWVCVLVAAVVLPLFLFKKALGTASQRSAGIDRP